MKQYRNSLSLALLGASIAFAASTNATAQRCTFTTHEVHYATLASPAETFAFSWDTNDNAVTDFTWLHGAALWVPFAGDPGSVQPDGFPGDHHLRVNLGITTAGYTDSRYEIRGYLAPNIEWPNATFAGVYEGTGTAWIVAYGQVNCN